MQAVEKAAVSDAHQEFEDGLVSVFAELADLFGNPRSHGQIYGLLFSSPGPLTMDEITERLGISKGSVSQGLRALEDLGAVERISNGRFGHYSAKLELKTLIGGFVRQRLIPRLEKSNSTLKELELLVAGMPEAEAKEVEWKLRRVAQWHTRATQFLPLAQRILQSASKLLPKADG